MTALGDAAATWEETRKNAMAHLGQLFDRLDTDGSGTLDHEEGIAALKADPECGSHSRSSCHAL